jgi:hypothetical protein
LWRFDQLSHNTDAGGLGSIKAKFDLSSGPSTASVIQAQFTCLDTTISGIDFELTGIGYRVSLVKKQISSGILYSIIDFVHIFVQILIILTYFPNYYQN